MDTYKRLLLANKAWVHEKLELKPDYFKRLAREQQPEFLWIGCSDSRVPAEEITGTQPGEIFVHRNIANLVVHTDFNLLSVLQFAVDVLKVQHVIVCGHYGCGGVRASMSHQPLGLLNKWLRHLKDVYHRHKDELSLYADDDRRGDRLAELNVLEQVQNLARTSIVQRAWHTGQPVALHGWIYGLADGYLKDLVVVDSSRSVDDIYRFKFDDEPT